MSESTPNTALLEGPATAEDTGTKKILLLDGVRLFLQLEQTLLQRSDYQLFAATTGAEALEILERESLDLVLLDYVLPDMTGDEIVRRIRSSERNSEAGIVIVTARGMRDHVDKCMAAGCSAFLYKPVTRTTLCSHVQDMLRVPARRHVRTLVRLQVNARNRERFFFGNTVNLSESGLLLETPLELSMGETMSLRFFLPGEEEAVACRARVTRRTPTDRPGEWAYGLSFEELGAGGRERVAGFVQAQEIVGDQVGQGKA
jgi:CheY-like chemotaxis protein